MKTFAEVIDHFVSSDGGLEPYNDILYSISKGDDAKKAAGMVKLLANELIPSLSLGQEIGAEGIVLPIEAVFGVMHSCLVFGVGVGMEMERQDLEVVFGKKETGEAGGV